MYLEHSPADIVRHLLVSLGAGSLPTSKTLWPISVSEELDKPDNTITLYDTESGIDSRTQLTGEINYRYGIQIRFRASDHFNLMYKANSVLETITKEIYRDYIALKNPVSKSNITYLVHTITPVTGIIDLGKLSPIVNLKIATLNIQVPITKVVQNG